MQVEQFHTFGVPHSLHPQWFFPITLNMAQIPADNFTLAIQLIDTNFFLNKQKSGILYVNVPNREDVCTSLPTLEHWFGLPASVGRAHADIFKPSTTSCTDEIIAKIHLKAEWTTITSETQRVMSESQPMENTAFLEDDSFQYIEETQTRILQSPIK